MSVLYNIKYFMKIVYMPLVIFISLYTICLAIYSLSSNEKDNEKYFYNINFNFYVMGIVATIFSFGFVFMYTMDSIKVLHILNIYSLVITLVLGFILYLLLNKFIGLIRIQEKDDIEYEKRQKELKMMLEDKY